MNKEKYPAFIRCVFRDKLSFFKGRFHESAQLSNMRQTQKELTYFQKSYNSKERLEIAFFLTEVSNSTVIRFV
jgi:hypothetical protein